jgi:hypothetical protein
MPAQPEEHRPGPAARVSATLVTVFVAGVTPGLATAAAPMRFLVQMRYQERIEWYRHFAWSLPQQTVVCSWSRDAKGFDQAKYRFAKAVPVMFTRYGNVVAMSISPSFRAHADVNLWREASGDMPAESSTCDPAPVSVRTTSRAGRRSGRPRSLSPASHRGPGSGRPEARVRSSSPHLSSRFVRRPPWD